jgi:pimeloyl-ACP methyl ester carboxylesterase
MRRRDFITLLGGAAAAWPLAAHAQQPDRVARIGYIGPDRTAPLGAAIYQAFLDEMQIHGFKNGQNLVVEFRRLEQDLRALSGDAAELVRLNVDVLFADGTETALQAAVSASRTLPIVMIATNFDPFARGYVKSLARPDLASHIVETKAAHFDPSKFDDRYEDALKDLLRKKQEGKPIVRPERREPAKVINLIDALRRSVEASGAGRSAKAKARQPATGHQSEQTKRKKAKRAN